MSTFYSRNSSSRTLSIAGHNHSGYNDIKYVHDSAGSYIKFSSENMPYRFPVLGASLQDPVHTVPIC
nr:MAG TPA: hypothetical protein [Bacteriophage sp.]